MGMLPKLTFLSPFLLGSSREDKGRELPKFIPSSSSFSGNGYTMFHLQQLWVHVEDVLQFSSHLDFSCVYYLKLNSTGKLKHA
ncbi:hypothetical protein Lal_00014149 [Lupinus albus]|nr:hypothetical protein Lal_00014149 [Lupinus albus]